MKLRRVVVTGLGSLTPIGKTVPEFWNNLLRGVSGSGVITHFDPEKFKCKIACELKGYDPKDYFDRKESRRLDPFAQYGIIAAEQAIADSRLDEIQDKESVGVIWGSGVGGVNSIQKECMDYAIGNRTPRFSAFFIPQLISDSCAGQISIQHGFSGPNYVTAASCASSAIAISDAFDMIRLGKANAIVCGGSEAAIIEAGIGGFAAMQALSTRNDAPSTASRPFDKGRDGFVMGEGGACLILEELGHALERNAHIYGEVMGCGLTADAYHITASHPEGQGAMKAMQLALKEGGLREEDVDHINCHGTSTPLGDISETKAITTLFGEHAEKISLNSTKSMTGHLLGAAGALEAIATVLTLQYNTVPPTINHFEDDPEIPNLDFTFGKAKERVVNVALSNAFGFGGHNVSIAFRKYSQD